MDIVKIILVGIIGAVFALTIKNKQPEIALQVSIAAGLIIFIFIINYLYQAVEYINRIVNRYNIPLGGITLVLKIIGIAYICEFGALLLKDSGENSLALKVELGGRVIIIVMTLPLITTFIDMILKIAG
jgi:stage III sporulation protein AD